VPSVFELDHLVSFWQIYFSGLEVFMFESISNQTWLLLSAIPDRVFQRTILNPEFSRISPNGREINVYRLFPWAVSDFSGNPRYAGTAEAVRGAWAGHAQYGLDFLQVARQLRYA